MTELERLFAESAEWHAEQERKRSWKGVPTPFDMFTLIVGIGYMLCMLVPIILIIAAIL